METKQKFKVPKITTNILPLGNLKIKFEGKRYNGSPILDTKVSLVGEQSLCWITWKDREEFYKKISAVIEEFRI